MCQDGLRGWLLVSGYIRLAEIRGLPIYSTVMKHQTTLYLFLNVAIQHVCGARFLIEIAS
jgi:hypothetical protein